MRNLFVFFHIIYSKRIVKFLLIPVTLFIFWILASIVLVYYPPSFSVVSKYHSRSDIQNFSDKKILKGDKINGSVNASENNFGILVIRFNPSTAVPYKDEDRLLFRLKEKGSDRWLVENSYKSGLINEVPFFPFGFPKMKNSKGKTYQFQIESLKGNNLNALSLSSENPVIESQYQFSKSVIFNDIGSFENFMAMKLSNFLADTNSILLSFPYFLPFIIYVFLLFLQKSSPSIFYVVLLSMITDVLTNYRTVYFAGEIILIFAWVFCLIRYKLSSSISFFFSVIFVLFALSGIVLSQPLVLQKASEWTYYLLVVGTGQTIWEIRNNNLKLISLRTFLINSLKHND